jgi:hypothetical protein
MATKKSNLSFSKFFFSYYISCLLIEGSGSVQVMTDPDTGGPKTDGSYRSGSTTLMKKVYWVMLGNIKR